MCCPVVAQIHFSHVKVHFERIRKHISIILISPIFAELRLKTFGILAAAKGHTSLPVLFFFSTRFSKKYRYFLKKNRYFLKKNRYFLKKYRFFFDKGREDFVCWKQKKKFFFISTPTKYVDKLSVLSEKRTGTFSKSTGTFLKIAWRKKSTGTFFQTPLFAGKNSIKRNAYLKLSFPNTQKLPFCP